MSSVMHGGTATPEKTEGLSQVDMHLSILFHIKRDVVKKKKIRIHNRKTKEHKIKCSSLPTVQLNTTVHGNFRS